MKHKSKYLQILSLIFLLSGSLVTIHSQTPSESPKVKPTPKASPTPSQIPPKIYSRLQALSNEFTQTQAILSEGQQLSYMTAKEIPLARQKLNKALSKFQSLIRKTDDKQLREEILKLDKKPSAEAILILDQLGLLSKASTSLIYSALANTHGTLGEGEKQIKALKNVIAISQEIIKNKSYQDNRNEFFVAYLPQIKSQIPMHYDLMAGTLDNHLGKIDESIKYRKKAIKGFREDYEENPKKEYKLREALSLFSLGITYSRNSGNTKIATDYVEQSMKIYRTFPDQKGKVAEGLSMIGIFYLGELNLEKVLKYSNEALKMYQEMNDKHGQANVLQFIASFYFLTNNQTKSRENIKKSLSILESDDYEENWKTILTLGFPKQIQLDKKWDYLVKKSRFNDIALSYELLENYSKAVVFYKKALHFSRLSNWSGDVRTNLNSIGYALAKQKKWDESAKYFKDAYEISLKSGTKEDIAKNLQDVGWGLLEAGNYKEAIKYQNESLLIFQSIGVGEEDFFSLSFSNLLNELGRTHYSLKNKRLAILYGKRAVNSMQRERLRIQNLDPIAQKGFLEKKEKHYRRLAEWLVESGRIVEAERVLQMLKQEEIADYLRKDRTFAEKLSLRVEYTKTEAEAIKDFEENSENLSAIGAEFSKLENLKRNGVKLTDKEEKQFAEINSKLTKANQEFQDFLEQLDKRFRKGKDDGLKSSTKQNIQGRLKGWGEGISYIYTVVNKGLNVVLLPSDVNVSKKSIGQITSAELNKKIFAFRQAVQNPKVDPRPLGKELYDVLIKPFEKELDAAKTKTILWSLDANLRLLPLAALWDGKQYLGQKYQNVVITEAGLFDLGDEVSTNLNVLGLGVSEAKTVKETLIERKLTFNALPSVPFEIDSIVKTTKSPKGVLDGESLLNAGFTRKSFAEQLSKGYKIVHIASHFSMNAGDASRSFLLLGDGTTLAVSELNINPSFKQKFQGVELLTLSACDTAVGATDSNGKEVEGFAYVAQQNGAKAILATLWSVADNSTALMMAEFYRIKKENPQFTKAKAMQLAQQAMIDGKLKTDTKGNKKGVETFKNGSKTNNLPKFNTDKNKPFAHPYYWSPFVLIGNWK